MPGICSNMYIVKLSHILVEFLQGDNPWRIVSTRYDHIKFPYPPNLGQYLLKQHKLLSCIPNTPGTRDGPGSRSLVKGFLAPQETM